jgi:hypothetical protein
MNTRFLNRFHRLWARKRRVQFGQALATTALIGAIALCLLAAADYALELSIGWRTGLLALAAATVAVFGGRALWKAARLGARPKTAEEMEKAFPQLGQSVRTTVQYVPMQAGELKSQGVAESLVSALADNTESQTRPLPLDVVIPSKLFWGLTAGVLAVCMVAAAASAFDWEWRTAAQRIALGDGAYRSLEVSPGDVLVDEGHSTDLSVTLVGRADRDVVLQTRQANTEDAEWTDQTLEPAKGGDEKPAAHTSSKPPRKSFTSHLVRLTEPVEYRVAAAGIVSPTYRIDIRRPVKIESMKVELTPPTYTRQATATISDGNISALAGTEARWTVRFDKPVKSAAFVFAVKRVATDTAEPEPETIPLTLSADSKEGSATATNIGQTDMVLNEDRNYSITAEAIDGTVLAPAKYRIRIREDQPPQVSFESPMDGIEVHALAELPVRVRVSDDYVGRDVSGQQRTGDPADLGGLRGGRGCREGSRGDGHALADNAERAGAHSSVGALRTHAERQRDVLRLRGRQPSRHAAAHGNGHAVHRYPPVQAVIPVNRSRPDARRKRRRAGHQVARGTDPASAIWPESHAEHRTQGAGRTDSGRLVPRPVDDV